MEENSFSDTDFQSGISAELESQYKVLLDKSNTLENRLEAFEFITDSEVGDTPLIRARNLERFLDIRQVFLKFEGGNPTGTQKDRIAFAQAHDALRRGFDTICLATCGNYGAACSLAARYAGLECKIFIPEKYHSRRIAEMEAQHAQIIRVPGDYENAVLYSQKEAQKHEWYDANPGGDNTALQLKAYGEIAYEIYDDLRDAPKAVAIPVSNGTVLAGIYRGFLSLYRRGKTSRMPILIAGSTKGRNPIIEAFIKNKPRCEDLQPTAIRETQVNEPLVNWHSFDGDLALDAIRKTGGWATMHPDKRLLELTKVLKEKEGLMVLPAATAGLAAFIQQPNPDMLQNDRFVVVITSRNS